MKEILTNEHREALAFVAAEIGKAQTLDAGRALAQDIQWRCTMLLDPNTRARYVQVRGFDPREASPAPRVRWLR